MWAKYIMPTVTGFINQTDYSMSQALTNKEWVWALATKNEKYHPSAYCDLLQWIRLSVC